MSDNDTSSHGRDMAIVPPSIVAEAIMGYLQCPRSSLSESAFCVMAVHVVLCADSADFSAERKLPRLKWSQSRPVEHGE